MISQANRKIKALRCLKKGIRCIEDKYYFFAYPYFEKAIELDPECAEAYFQKALLLVSFESYYKDEIYDEIVSDFNKAIELKPKYSDVYYYKGLFEYKTKQFNLAVLDFEAALKLNYTHPDIYKYNGLSHLNLKNYTDAIENFNSICENMTDETYSYCYLYRGISYYYLNNFELAIEDFRKIIAKHSKLDYAYFYCGLSELKLKNFYKAIIEFKNTLKVNPYYNNAYLYLSHIKYLLHDYKEVVNEMMKFIEIKIKIFEIRSFKLDYKNPEFYLNDNCDAICDFYDAELNKNENDYLLHFLKGIWKFYKNRHIFLYSDFSDFKKSIQLKPDFELAYLYIGINSLLKEDHMYYFKKAIEINPKNPISYCLLNDKRKK